MAIALLQKCPRCGSPLEIVEYHEWIFYGCYRCLRYVSIEREQARKAFFSGGVFDWRGLVEYLHRAYMYYYYGGRRRRR